MPEEVIRAVDPNVLASMPVNIHYFHKHAKARNRCLSAHILIHQAELPTGTVVKSISAHGVSNWTRTARIDTILDGGAIEYFLKVSSPQLLIIRQTLRTSQVSAHDRGREMLKGEFTSMTCIHKAVPDFCPKPIAWGTYSMDTNCHFFLCEFRHMDGNPPAAVPFANKMAELHLNAVSPNGKFGFPVITCHGNTPLDHGWADTWEEYFVTRTRALLPLEEASQGPSDELKQLIEPFFHKVAPRLLRPLETKGHSIVPRLVHGDCWHGNASMDERTGLPIIFDAACFYAHNECT